MRRRLLSLLLIVGLAACTPPAAKPGSSDGCAQARNVLLAHASSVAKRGFIDRASVDERAAWLACPSSDITRRYATRLEELGRTYELDGLIAMTTSNADDRAFVMAMAAKVRASGSSSAEDLLERAKATQDPIEARRLFDQALNRFEARHNARPWPQVKDVLSPPKLLLGKTVKWFAVGRTAVNRVSSKTIAIDGVPSVFSPNERWLATIEIAPEKKQTQEQAHRDGDRDRDRIVFVDLENDSRFDITQRKNQSIAFDATNRFAVIADYENVVIVDLEKRTSKELHFSSSFSVNVAGPYAFVQLQSELRIIALETANEVWRKDTYSAAPSGDGLRVAYAGAAQNELFIRDIPNATQKRLVVPPPGCGGFNYSPNVWTKFGEKEVEGHRCSSEEIFIDLTTGKARIPHPQPKVMTGADVEQGVADSKQRFLDEGEASCKRANGTRCSSLFLWEHPATNAQVAEGHWLIPIAQGIVSVKRDRGSVVALEESRYFDVEPPDARSIAIASTTDDWLLGLDGTMRARLWDLKTGKVVWRAPARPETVSHAALAPNGDLVTASPIGTLRRWTNAKALSATWNVPIDCRVESLAVRDDNTAVLACTSGGTIVTVFAMGNATPIAKIDLPHLGADPALRTIALDASGRRLLTSEQENKYKDEWQLRLWELDQPNTKPFVIPDAEWFHAAVFGEWLAFKKNSELVIMSTTNPTTPERKLRTHWSATLAADGSFAAGVLSGEIHTLALDSSNQRLQFKVEQGLIDEETPVFIHRAAGVFARNRDELLGWSFAEPTAPKRLAPYRPVLAATPDGRVVLGGSGVRLTRFDDLLHARDLVALPFTSSGMSATLAEYQSLSITNDEAAQLGKCVIGPVTLPLEACLGRLAPPE